MKKVGQNVNKVKEELFCASERYMLYFVSV